jgi:hypothetical protein
VFDADDTIDLLSARAKMRGGTAPAAVTGRELRGRRTTEQYLFAFSPACSAFMERRHPIALELGKAGLQAGLDPQHDEHRASLSYRLREPVADDAGCKIVQSTRRRHTRETVHNSDSVKGARI